MMSGVHSPVLWEKKKIDEGGCLPGKMEVNFPKLLFKA